MIPIPLQGFHKGAHPRAKCLQLVSPRGLETSELVFTVPDAGIQRTNSPSGVEGERGDKMECQLIFVFPGSSKCWQATSWRVGGRGLGTTFNLLVFIDILLALGQGMLKLATVIGSCPHPVLQLMYLLLELFQLLQTLFLFPPCIPLAPVGREWMSLSLSVDGRSMLSHISMHSSLRCSRAFFSWVFSAISLLNALSTFCTYSDSMMMSSRNAM